MGNSGGPFGGGNTGDEEGTSTPEQLNQAVCASDGMDYIKDPADGSLKPIGPCTHGDSGNDADSDNTGDTPPEQVVGAAQDAINLVRRMAQPAPDEDGQQQSATPAQKLWIGFQKSR